MRLLKISLFARIRALPATPITFAVWVSCVTLWLAAVVFDGRQVGPVTAWAWSSGVEIWDGRYLALLTATFIHYDLTHLTFNLYWLLQLGAPLEKALGRARFAGLLIVAAVVTSAAQLAVSDSTGVGLSGVSYTWAAFAWLARDRFSELRGVVRVRDALLLAAWLGLGFALSSFGMMQLGNGAHLGGLALGTALGLASMKRRVVRVIGWVASALLMLTAAVSVRWAPWNVDWLMHRAEVALLAEDLEQADDLAQRALALSADGARAQWIRGRAALARGENELAIDHFERAVEINPGFVDAHVRLGRAYDSQGDCDKAVVSLTKAIELNPDHGEAFYWRGECRGKLGEHALAVDDLRRALQLTPDVSFVPAALGWAQIRLDADPCQALTHFDRAIKLGLDDVYVRSGRATANICCGNLQEAFNDLEPVLAATDADPQNFGVRCLLRFQLDDTQGAIPDCLQALAGRPTVFHRLLLALVTLASGDQDAGFKLLRQAVTEDLTQVLPRLWLYWLGKNESALADVSAEGWHADLLSFARSEIDADELVRRSQQASSPRVALGQACQAHTFIGLWHEHSGDAADAIASYRAAVAQRMPMYVEDGFARARLRAFGVSLTSQ